VYQKLCACSSWLCAREERTQQEEESWRESETRRVIAKRNNVGLLTTLIVAMGVGSAFADYTLVKGPAGTEKSHAEILGQIYGGGTPFTASGDDLGYGLSTEFSFNSITASRIDDYGTGLNDKIDIISGGIGDIDQFWCDGLATITATVHEAGYDDQTFGWNGGSGLDFIKIVSWGEDPVEDFVLSGEFLWADRVLNGGYHIYWSAEEENSGNLDRMVTYKISGLTDPQYLDKTVWLLFWEDLPFESWDQDYQDLVVELSAAPEPTSMLLFGLGAAVLLRKRRT